jgi:hypothetical protein
LRGERVPLVRMTLRTWQWVTISRMAIAGLIHLPSKLFLLSQMWSYEERERERERKEHSITKNKWGPETQTTNFSRNCSTSSFVLSSFDLDIHLHTMPQIPFSMCVILWEICTKLRNERYFIVLSHLNWIKVVKK